MKDIILTAINAKWIHPSLALRLLKANLGELEDRCEIIEFALRQPLQEKIDRLSGARPRILGISVSIWNHDATIELLRELKKIWNEKQTIDKREETENAHKSNNLLPAACCLLPKIIMGGPEVSHLPPDAEIFKHADYVIRGEGEIAFRELCGKILAGEKPTDKFIEADEVNVSQIKTAYHLYTDEDVSKKLIYVETSRGCPFNCEFCLSSVKKEDPHTEAMTTCFAVVRQAQRRRERREFELELFFKEMSLLISRDVKTFKFLDRTFNANIKRAIQICEFFLEKLNDRLRASLPLFTVHFEIVPTLFTAGLLEVLARFPPDTLRLEIGIQTLNPHVAARIGLPGRSGKTCGTGKTAKDILAPLHFLREKTNAIIHADLIAGLPGEDLDSFGRGFDALWEALTARTLSNRSDGVFPGFEIQLGILKQLPGAPISRHNKEFKMRYNPEPPYEVMETSSMSARDLARLKNFARFWEMLVNRGLLILDGKIIFARFLALSDSLYGHFGRNWGIDKDELKEISMDYWHRIMYNYNEG